MAAGLEPALLRKATVTAVGAVAGTVDLTLADGVTSHEGVYYLRPVTNPTAGDIVMAAHGGETLLVLGAVGGAAAAAQIDQATVDTTETRTATTFGDLATAGPSVTLTMTVGQVAACVVEAHFQVDVAGAVGAVFTLQVDGPSTSDLAAADTNGCETGVVGEWIPGTKHTLFTATAAGDHTFSMKYRAIGATTAEFKRRRITVELK